LNLNPRILGSEFFNLNKHTVKSLSDGSKLIFMEGALSSLVGLGNKWVTGGAETYTWDSQNGYAVLRNSPNEFPEFTLNKQVWELTENDEQLKVFPSADGIDYLALTRRNGTILLYRYQNRKVSFVRGWSLAQLNELAGFSHTMRNLI
jgi:hypothetical protein